MPQLRASEWVYEQGEVTSASKDPSVRAENKPGHRPIASYSLPKWVYHPDQPQKRVIVEKSAYYGMAADGSRNFENWNVAHVAAIHDDLKLLSLATPEQCKEPNKWGMTPAHMTGMGQHPYGPSTAVLYELIQMGAADPEATNDAMQTPWHIAQRMHKVQNLRKFEKVLLKGHKPDHYEGFKAAQTQLRGKFARPPSSLAALSDGTLPVCIVFPGQGSQYVGMMQSLKGLPAVASMIEKATGILGYDIMDLITNGPEEELSKTKVCQPAMYIAGLAALEQLKMDEPEKVSGAMAVAGLSLGEYTALTAAGVFDFETGLRLVKERAEAMEFETVKEGAQKQAMLSVAGLEQDVVEDLCRQVLAGKPAGVCEIANFLFPKGFAVSGTEEAVQELESKAKDAQALQVKLVRTSGGFHTSLMAGAKEHLKAELEKAQSSMQPPKMNVYMNVTATTIGPQTPVSDIIRLLGEQLVSPVLWEQSMRQAVADGCKEFYECGPSKQLKAMMKRIDPKVGDKMSNILA